MRLILHFLYRISDNKNIELNGKQKEIGTMVLFMNTLYIIWCDFWF